MQKTDCVEMAIVYSLYGIVPLKISSRSQKSNQLFCHNERIYQLWPKSTVCYMRYVEILFWMFQSDGVTLKIRSRSLKSILFLFPDNVFMQVWSKSIQWFKR